MTIDSSNWKSLSSSDELKADPTIRVEMICGSSDVDESHPGHWNGLNEENWAHPKHEEFQSECKKRGIDTFVEPSLQKGTWFSDAYAYFHPHQLQDFKDVLETIKYPMDDFTVTGNVSDEDMQAIHRFAENHDNQNFYITVIDKRDNSKTAAKTEWPKSMSKSEVEKYMHGLEMNAREFAENSGESYHDDDMLDSCTNCDGDGCEDCYGTGNDMSIQQIPSHHAADNYELTKVKLVRLPEVDIPSRYLVDDYRSRFEDGSDFPPIVLSKIDREVLDGRHRIQAARELGHTHIWSYVPNVDKTAHSYHSELGWSSPKIDEFNQHKVLYRVHSARYYDDVKQNGFANGKIWAFDDIDEALKYSHRVLGPGRPDDLHLWQIDASSYEQHEDPDWQEIEGSPNDSAHFIPMSIKPEHLKFLGPLDGVRTAALTPNKWEDGSYDRDAIKAIRDKHFVCKECNGGKEPIQTERYPQFHTDLTKCQEISTDINQSLGLSKATGFYVGPELQGDYYNRLIPEHSRWALNELNRHPELSQEHCEGSKFEYNEDINGYKRRIDAERVCATCEKLRGTSCSQCEGKGCTDCALSPEGRGKHFCLYCDHDGVSSVSGFYGDSDEPCIYPDSIYSDCKECSDRAIVRCARNTLQLNGWCYEHAWNKTPDGTIIDASADQFGSGDAVRVIPKDDPRQAWYQVYDDDAAYRVGINYNATDRGGSRVRSPWHSLVDWSHGDNLDVIQNHNAPSKWWKDKYEEDDEGFDKESAYSAEDISANEDPRPRPGQDPEPWSDVAQPSMANGSELIIPGKPSRTRRTPLPRRDDGGDGGYPGADWSTRPIHQSPDDLTTPDALGQVTGANIGQLNPWWRTAKKFIESGNHGHNLAIEIGKDIRVYHKPCPCGNVGQTQEFTPHHKNKSKDPYNAPDVIDDWVNKLGLPREMFNFLLGKPQKKKKQQVVEQQPEPEQSFTPDELQVIAEHLRSEHGWDSDDEPGMLTSELKNKDDAYEFHASLYPKCFQRISAVEDEGESSYTPKNHQWWSKTLNGVAFHDPALSTYFWSGGDNEANTEHRKRIPAILRKGLIPNASKAISGGGWMSGRPGHAYLAVNYGDFKGRAAKFPLVIDFNSLSHENVHADEDALGYAEMTQYQLPRGFRSVGEYADTQIEDNVDDIYDSLGGRGTFSYNDTISSGNIKLNPAWVRENQKTIDKWGKTNQFWKDGYKQFLYSGECFDCKGKGGEKCEECKGVGNLKCEECQGRKDIKCQGHEGKDCDYCDGSGREECPTCFGEGTQMCGETGRQFEKALNEERSIGCGGDGVINCSTCGGSGQLGSKKRMSKAENSLPKVHVANWKSVVSSSDDNDLIHHYWSALGPEVERFIVEHAADVNGRAENYYQDDAPVGMPPYCNSASLQWMQEFFNHGVQGARMISGHLSEQNKAPYPDSTSHVWIQFDDGGIFDPTASQFNLKGSPTFNPRIKSIKNEYYKPDKTMMTVDDLLHRQHGACVFRICDNYGQQLSDNYCPKCGTEYDSEEWGSIKRIASTWRHTDEDGFEMWETTEDPNQYAIIENDDQYDLYELQGSFNSPEEAKGATKTAQDGGGGGGGGGGAGGGGGGASGGGASGGGASSGGSAGGDGGASGGDGGAASGDGGATGDGSGVSDSTGGESPQAPSDSEPKPSYGPAMNTSGSVNCPRCNEQCYSMGNNYYSCALCGWFGAYTYPKRKRKKVQAMKFSKTFVSNWKSIRFAAFEDDRGMSQELYDKLISNEATRYMYHEPLMSDNTPGDRSVATQQILQQGLLPLQDLQEQDRRYQDNDWWGPGLGSDPSCVYMSIDANAPIRIDLSKVDRKNLHADEDILRQEYKDAGDNEDEDYGNMFMEWADAHRHKPEVVARSYDAGTLAHIGFIPPEALSLNPNVRTASWFDQVNPKEVEIPEEPVMRDITPRLQDMYMTPVEEEEDPEKKERWTVEPTAFDLWSVHGSRADPDPNQSSLFDDPDQRDREIEEKAVADERARTSPLSEKFRFVTQPARNVDYGDTCMNGMMTCQYGGKIQSGQKLVHVIDRNTNKVLFRFHPDDEVGSSCKRNATEYLHDFIQRKPE